MTYPTFKEAFIVVFGLLVALWSTKNLPLIWHHRTSRYDHVPGWWLWGGPLWRGFVRGMPVGIAGWWSLIIAYIGILLANRDLIPKDVPLFPASLMGLCFILCVLISLFNWPTILVAPHLRSQNGAFAEWLGKGKRRPRIHSKQ
jgi:hypothetical protein